MATTTIPQPTADDPVYQPLDRLRGIIRTYVLIEGFLSLLLFAIAWFVLVLVFDFGVFKAFHWDWTQHASWWLRAVALAAALGTLLFLFASRIVYRLTTEFSYPALALVLERRFPKVLGDRLITAVELANVQQAARYGYSADMIRQTIREARERVGTVPVREVFNWRRLWRMGLLAVGSLLALVALGYGSYVLATGNTDPLRAAWKCYHVTALLFERDLLLENTPWPRKALLELRAVDRDGRLGPMPETGLRVARDGDPPRLVVKSYQWVIADRSRADGWRPLLWGDLTRELVGCDVPSLDFPGSPAAGSSAAGSSAAEAASVAVDAVLESPAFREALNNALGLERYREFQNVFDRLEALANDPAMERKLRRLEKPREVTFKYTGLKTAGDGVLKPEGDNLYAGDVTGLREDVLFTVRAEDFRTPQRAITLIPPPALLSLTRVEFQPAYLHHASPADGSWSDLKDLLQRMPEENLSLTGDRSVFAVPSGSEVVITGTTEKPISRAWGRPRVGRFPRAVAGSAALVELPVRDGHKFTVEFRGADRITSAVEFDLVFENEDRVRSSRQVLIQVIEDQAPQVEVALDVIRKVGKEYWVTPRAKLYFNPESNIRDDNGLSKVGFVVNYEMSDAAEVRVRRAVKLAQAAAEKAPTGRLGSLAADFADYVHQVRSDEADKKKTASFALGKFVALDGRLTRDTRAEVQRRLALPLTDDRPNLVKRLGLETKVYAQASRSGGRLESFKWVVDGDYFDVRALGLEVPPGEVQPRYELQLVVEATDTNYATGPKVGRSEPLSILVVSPGDLLVEIGRDEEKLGNKLDEAVKKLEAAKTKFAFVRSKSEQQLPEDLDPVKVRCRDALQDVVKARDTVQAVGREFRRLEREAIVNQLPESNLEQYGKFANRIDRALGDAPDPVSPGEDEQLRRGRSPERPFGELTPKATFAATEKQLESLQRDFDENRWPPVLAETADGLRYNRFTQAHNSIILLEAEVASLRQLLGEAQSQERLKNQLKSILERQDRISLALARKLREDEEERTKDTPKLGEVGQLFLAKGEAKKIRHAISWRQFKADELTVKLTSSDPAALTVPAVLKLDFERNQFDFEYEVRAAAKEGVFTITLTPEAGDKIEVTVVVK